MAHFKRNEKRMKRLIIVGIIGLVNVQKKKNPHSFLNGPSYYILLFLYLDKFCVKVYAHLCIYKCTNMWRSEVNLGCHASNTTTLFVFII